ncbi:terpene cyclase/mutase family protein [Methyloceanibacter caenitepidi]|uniref:Squalene-hopene cyclase n=1 Tax=Methyloceanibacter caenitepidi TaxID=1384459 RepID=A0A0A8K7L7_9HYPH|nr:terpene cyclase/mutase family protein [Methyloceanibacter caenitepidi]BAQ18542.1 squalene-hopene cyclase [Methyloceanibacter caenitepidi]
MNHWAAQKDLSQAVDLARRHLQDTQAPDGSWHGDYGGPVFLLPTLIVATHIVGEPFDPETEQDFIRFFKHHQNADGGWPLHIQGESYAYATALCYVAQRLLGVPADDPGLERARVWLLERGGAANLPPWGKFLLALLNLYDYDGVMPVPPELWLLPTWLPAHPSRFWCHSRMIFLPMSYLYGIRAQAPLTPVVRALRDEIFCEPYEALDFRGSQMQCAAGDIYAPLSRGYRLLNGLLNGYEAIAGERLRARATDFVLDQVRQEDENTNNICIGPINKVLNMLCWHFAEPDGKRVAAHRRQLPEYLWKGEHGTHMQGYNSSRLWDTAFAVQAICASGRAGTAKPMLELAHAYIEANQVLEDTPDRERYFRDPSQGGWPFSNRTHGWPISDCTAEGLKAAIALRAIVDEPIHDERLDDAAELILGWQNADGGWPTYEKARTPSWMEALNPSLVFADIMVDHSYVECTSACVQALIRYRDQGVDPARAQCIDKAIARGRDFLLARQRDDGAWMGAWGICFTYGTWFAVSALRAAGLPADSAALRRAAAFLVSHQLPDGGWGETIESCRRGTYASTPEGQVVMTSWAVLSLLQTEMADSEPVRAGLRFLQDRQRADGSWPDEAIAGVFNRTCAITYDNYRKIFGLWALGAADVRVNADMTVQGLPR